MSLDGVKTIFEIGYYIVAICAAIAAVIVYYQNRRLEQSRWASTFYEKFYEGERYRNVRVLLDSSESQNIEKLVDEESVEFTDYLNFFEHIAIFAESGQLTSTDVEASFAYYLNCLENQPKVRAYIENQEKGYEKLRAYLSTRKKRLMSEYLFLYGTLLPGDTTEESSQIVRRLKRVGSATVRGRLYDFGEYPGAVLDRTAKSSIKGELFELPNDDTALKALDDYEEFKRTDRKNSLFVRSRAVAELLDGRRLNAWVYVYNRNPGKARLIANGDYSKSKAA